MTLPRRTFLHLAAGAAVWPAALRLANAQSYPARTVRLIVGYPAGGGHDVVARIMAQWLSERLGQTFVVENRPGAASSIGTEAVVRAAPDGHTLLYVAPANFTNATLFDKLSFNFIRDIAPIASIMRTTYVMEVHPAVPARTVPEFIAYAKANPGKVNMGSSGTGGPPHLAGELFKMMAGVDMLHVPYRGSAPALTDMLGGQVQVMFDGLGSSIDHIRAGRLRALAVTTTARSDVLPDIPIVGDFLPGYEASAVVGIGAPRSTPAAIVDRLNREINAGLADPQLKARLVDMGGAVLASSPAEFGQLIVDETEKWAKVIKFAGIKPE